MAYSYTTLEAAENLLAGMLGDLQGNVSKVRWPSAELRLNLFEALRTWNALTGMWEATTDPIPLPAATAWLDIPSSTSLCAYTLTDQSLIGQIQYHLFEPYDPVDGTGMSAMWTFDEILGAVQRRRDQFLLETSCRLTRTVLPAAGQIDAGTTSYELPGTTVSLRRAAWVDLYFSRTKRLGQISTFTARSSRSRILQQPGTPQSCVVSGAPITIEPVPVPSSGGRLDLLTVEAGAELNPAGSGTLLGIPDDFAWVVKWGAMADLLGKDGPGRDYARALFCERRYRMGVAAALMFGSVTDASINGRHVHLDTIDRLDAGRPLWQSRTGRVSAIAAAGLNLLAVADPPSSPCQLELTVVRNAPIPEAGQYLQVGKEQLDTLLGYAAHLCMFKIGGTEFGASTHLADNFFEAAVDRNQRLKTSAVFEEERLGVENPNAKDRGLRRVTGATVADAGGGNVGGYGPRNQ